MLLLIIPLSHFHFVWIHIGCTERHGREVKTLSYSEGPGFKSRFEDSPSWLRFFVALLCLSRRMPEYNLKIVPRQLPSKSFPFTCYPFTLRYIVLKSKDVPLRHAGAKRGGSTVLILDLGARWGWVVTVTTRPRFTPVKGPPVPTGQEAGWASELVWKQKLEEKSFASTGDQTPVVQSVVRHYTVWATSAHNFSCWKGVIK
jgi:hypothetical protein